MISVPVVSMLILGFTFTGAWSPALSRISSEGPDVLGVIKAVDNDSTMIAITKVQVSFSRRSPVFFTPMMLLAAEPPRTFCPNG